MPPSSVKLQDEESKLLVSFVDLLDKCLALDPAKRITPKEALVHQPRLVSSPQESRSAPPDVAKERGRCAAHDASPTCATSSASAGESVATDRWRQVRGGGRTAETTERILSFLRVLALCAEQG